MGDWQVGGHGSRGVGDMGDVQESKVVILYRL